MRVCIFSWDSIKINIGCIFSVLVEYFLPFSFGVFFTKRESGGWAKWRLALPWFPLLRFSGSNLTLPTFVLFSFFQFSFCFFFFTFFRGYVLR